MSMKETQEIRLHARAQDEENKETKNGAARNYKWWIRIAMYILFLLCGQSSATLLGRLYYDKGGQKKWIAALVQVVGFPILLPLYFISSSSSSSSSKLGKQTKCSSPSLVALSMVYGILGLLIASGSVLASYGLSYLSASTFSIILASQLGFTAFFSFFLNSQKFTPFIINSIVLLTISSTLLACQPSSSSLSGVSKANHAIGFICTLGTAASAALGLSLSQFFFRRVIKKESFRAVVDMIIFELLVASCMILAGVFASGEWKDLSKEMEGFGLGKVSYVMTLVWTAIAWQVFQIGFVGLIFEVSSLFCNVISSLSLPIIQVMAAIVFHDHMNGLKVISMVLAIWGSVSYIYQNYLDDQESKSTTEDSYSNANSGVSKEASSI
ncbi:purine permease 21 [Ziziphus jujuba]|uniref:Probable purine permease n=1 Tax=Ziziphus jujuba TaxID=326968 RepID=A0ABM4ACJ9_ZIZJJ|nr:purine permease 21 [Ziziphus jujuba]